MKTKVSKKVISICLSLLICISALPLSMLSASAASYNINIRNIVYPRPGATPQTNFTYDGNLSYELCGWAWIGDDETAAMGPEDFVNFCSTTFSTNVEYYYELENFIDTVEYYLTFMFLIKNMSIPADTECAVTLYDENSNLMDVSAEGYYVPVSMFKSMVPEGSSLPDNWTDSDTILMCSSGSMICSPEDHNHISDHYCYDDNRHWRECNICDKQMFDSDSEHYNYNSGTESWICINQATTSIEGEYVKQCPNCAYVMERITVPKTGEQTVVTTYDELRNALAKGGKQWITLKFPSKICEQKDFESNNTLCVDDPEADITIDLNNCILDRTTVDDEHLFEVKQGSLRIWQKSGNGIDSTSTSSFHNNLRFSNATGESVFYVGESGSLKLTNVHALAEGKYAYNFPIVKSYGNLCIDSGVYKSDVDTPTVEVRSGDVVINGGKFESLMNGGTAVEFYGKDNNKTTATINYGNFGSYFTAVSAYKNTDVTINGGRFTYVKSYKNVLQSRGLYAKEADLTINGGSFYGSIYGLLLSEANSINITNGYFSTYNKNSAYAVYLIGDCSTNTTISGGTFIGSHGIQCSQETDFSKIIPDECYVTDDDTGLVINHKITGKKLGGSIRIDAIKPRITTQPSGGHSSVMGDAIVLNIAADNANEYTWHIIDEDGKELTWNYLSNNGYATPQVASGGKMLMLREVSDWMTGKRVYCVAKGYGGTVMSDIVELSVDKVIKYCNDLFFEDFDQIWNHKTVGDYKNPMNDADAPYTIGNVRWLMSQNILSDDYEFESGDNVVVAIDVIPKEGYTFFSTVYGKLNGIDSFLTVKNDDGSRSIGFKMTITVPDEYKTQNIELSVAEPVAGVKPSATATCTSGYAIPKTPTWTPDDTTFKSGTQYTVKIPVKAEYEWGDISTVTAKVNGKDAKFIAEHKGGKQYAYYVEYTFDATKDYMLGDVNMDGAVNITDATEIQKGIVGLLSLNEYQNKLADVNKDGNISINDATQIQKYLAGIIDKF